MVKRKKVLALIMGAIIAASVTSQMAVQVYAHDEGSSSSSYSYDESNCTSTLDEEESSSSSEPMEYGLGESELIRLENFKSERANRFLDRGSLQVDDSNNLYVSENNLVFEPTLDNEARLVCLDEEREFNGDIIVPERVNINDQFYLVTSIGNRAFYNCYALANATLPNSITEIGYGAFVNCRNIRLEVLPGNLREIGNFAFAYCSDLRLGSLPTGISEIGHGAFAHCINLRLEVLPEGITRIGDQVFINCVSLRSVALPAHLREIGSFAFMECRNLQLEALPEGLTRIGREAFSDCINLRLETLPEGLEIIGEEAFRSTAIRTITIPASVVELGNSAFETDSIEEINLAQGSRLNDGDIERAYGRQLGRVLGFEVVQEHLRIVGQEIITPVELNAEDAERKCPICQERFNEGEDVVGRLICGHYMHLDCFDEQVRNNFERGVPFKCPICRREYNIF